MRSEAVHRPVVHDNDPVAVLHRGNSLRDDELCGIGHVFRKPLPDLCIRRRIYRTGRIIKNQNLRILQQRSRNAEPLLLSAGDIRASLLNIGVIALRKPLDKLIRTGNPADPLALLLRSIFIAPAQILQNGSGEQDVLLQDNRHLVPQGFHVIIPHIHTADLDASSGHIIQTADQIHETRLCRAGSADDADALTGGNGKINVLQHRLTGALTVSKIHVLEHNTSVLDLLHRLFGVPQRRILIDDLRNTPAACLRHGHHDKNHRQEHQTVQNVHAVRQETHQLSRRQTSCNNHVTADPADQKDAAVHNRSHKRIVPGKLQLCLDEHQINISCRLAESADLVILPDIRLDHTDRRNIFLNTLVQIVITFKDLLEIRRGALHDQKQDDSKKHHRRKINTCQSRTDQEGHHKRHNHHRRRAHCHPDQHLKCILYVGYICGKTGHQT